MLAFDRRGTGHIMGHIVRTFGLDQRVVRRSPALASRSLKGTWENADHLVSIGGQANARTTT
jgi:hypothetical protein